MWLRIKDCIGYDKRFENFPRRIEGQVKVSKSWRESDLSKESMDKYENIRDSRSMVKSLISKVKCFPSSHHVS